MLADYDPWNRVGGPVASDERVVIGASRESNVGKDAFASGIVQRVNLLIDGLLTRTDTAISDLHRRLSTRTRDTEQGNPCVGP